MHTLFYSEHWLKNDEAREGEKASEAFAQPSSRRTTVRSKQKSSGKGKKGKGDEDSKAKWKATFQDFDIEDVPLDS